MACRAAPPPPLPVHAAPPTSPPAPPPSAAVPSYSGCTDLPLPDGISRPPALTKEQNRLLAEAGPILAEPSARERAAGRAFAQARALLDAKRWPEATRAFGEIALAYPRQDLGVLSAMLYLEGLNLLGSLLEPPRPVCYDEMSARLPALQRLYCENGEDRRHPQECRLFFRIELDLERGGGCGIPSQPAEPPAVLLARSGARYLALAVRCVEAARLAGVSPIDDRCDALAFHAALAFLHVPDRARAEEARALLLDPKNGMLKSPRVEELERRWK